VTTPTDLDLGEPSPPPRPRRPNRRIVAIVAGIVGLAAAGFLLRPLEPQATASESKGDAPVQEGDRIRFSEAFAKRAGISSVAVSESALAPSVSVNGTVTYDARKFAAVGARIAGRVRHLTKVVGDRVKPGDVLAEIESAELGRATAAVMAARAKELAAEADMKRERRLADARITAERDAELAKANHEAARAERIAAERTALALSGEPNAADGEKGELGILKLRSPIAGKITASKVSHGLTVEPTDTLFEVADLGSLWVELRVFERDVGAVREGDKVEVRSSQAPAPIEGAVAHVGDVVDVETRTAGVRVVVDNSAGLLRPGQSVHATIKTTAPAAKTLTVPRGAVTRVDGKAIVFVLSSPLTAEARPVAVGAEDATHVAILDGLRAGEKIVTGGMFALKSELFR
jgi:membrane fusion protein, heavy metal efflux system